MAGTSFDHDINKLLRGAKKIVVLAVGDELDPRDCLGYLAGKRISSLRLKGISVLLTAQMPENFTAVVRKLKPSHVVIIDAAEMGGSPGDVAFIGSEGIVATRVSTHAMPLSALMEYLKKELGVNVALIGIQPATPEDVESGVQPPAVQKGLARIANGFASAEGGGKSR